MVGTTNDLLWRSSACGHRRLSFGQRSLLAGGNEKLRVFHGRVLQNAVAEIQNVAVAAELGDDIQGGFANLFRRAEQNGGIKIALHRDAWSGEGAEFAKRYAPIHAENVGSRFHDGGKQVVRGLGVINDRDGVAQAGYYLLNRRKNEFGVILQIKFAAPGVENLNSGYAGRNLAFEIQDRGLRDLVQEFAEDFRLA